jgi:Na+-transporting NADH:ubiquinone oxidoreductase subunit NqrF
MEAAMLAEIFIMRLEATARAAGVLQQTLASSTSVFVPIDTGRQVAVKESKVRLLKDGRDALPTIEARARITD